MHEPYILLNGLSLKDLEDLLIDIKIYVELDKGNNIDLWNDMTVIVEDELFKLMKNANNPIHESGSCVRREGIHDCVAKDVAEIFRKKNTNQLNELRLKIENKINSRSDGVFVFFQDDAREEETLMSTAIPAQQYARLAASQLHLRTKHLSTFYHSPRGTAKKVLPHGAG